MKIRLGRDLKIRLCTSAMEICQRIMSNLHSRQPFINTVTYPVYTNNFAYDREAIIFIEVVSSQDGLQLNVQDSNDK